MILKELLGETVATKQIIAHELGHAISGVVQDNYLLPYEIEFNEVVGTTASCSVEFVSKRGLKGPFSTLKNVSDLGGVFGELVFCKKFEPWGCRVDIDNFISSNLKSTRGVIHEVDMWFNVEEDGYSFYVIRSTIPYKNKKRVLYDETEFECRLPNMYEIYEDFLNRIDVKEFRACVNEIYRGKITNIDKDELFGYIERITF